MIRLLFQRSCEACSNRPIVQSSNQNFRDRIDRDRRSCSRVPPNQRSAHANALFSLFYFFIVISNRK